MFQPTETSLIVMVPILDDSNLEGVEQFTAMLSLPVGQVGVTLGANMATVEITDDDCKLVIVCWLAINKTKQNLMIANASSVPSSTGLQDYS